MDRYPQANGATFNGAADSAGDCYAEIGTTGRNSASAWRTCTLEPKFCQYIVGDGTGGTNENIGDAASREECVNLVLALRPFANGATYPTDGGRAWYVG
jgi:hypothetical protein